MKRKRTTVNVTPELHHLLQATPNWVRQGAFFAMVFERPIGTDVLLCKKERKNMRWGRVDEQDQVITPHVKAMIAQLQHIDEEMI